MSYRPTELWNRLHDEERSLRWLARKVDCSHSYLSRLKTGSSEQVSDELAQRIAATLGVPVTELFAPVGDAALVAGGK